MGVRHQTSFFGTYRKALNITPEPHSWPGVILPGGYSLFLTFCFCLVFGRSNLDRTEMRFNNQKKP